MLLDDIPFFESVTFSSEEEVYIGKFNIDEVSTSTAIISLLSEVIDNSMTELSPLSDSVNVDALDRLMENPSLGQYDGKVVIKFSHQNYQIKVINEGVIKIYLNKVETTD